MSLRILSSLLIIFLGLFSGYLLRVFHQKNNSILSFSLDIMRKQSQRIALLFFMPILFTLTVWVVDFKSIKIAFLPLLGIFELFAGGIFALFIANFLRYPWQKKGSFIICGTFANLGGIGGLVCYMLLGEKGFAYVPIYTLFISLSFFSVGLPLTKIFSNRNIQDVNFFYSFIRGLKDIYVIVAFVSVAVGIILNLYKIPRPENFSKITAFLIPFTNYIILFSIGTGIRFSKIRLYVSECLWLSMIRYLLVPLTVIAFAVFLGYGHIDNGILLKTIIILSAMPMANNSVMAASLYDLNLDLANSAYFFTTLALALVIPILFLIVKFL